MPSNYDDKPKSVADHSAQIQEQLHTVYQEYRPSKVAGIASGGLWALKFAQELDWDIKEVIQIDTGYPRISMSDFRFLPRDPKRSFLIARHTPRILLAAHKVVANDFFTSADGMDRVLSFFYRGQEFDQSLLNADPEFRLFTERLINYSFEQIEQLVFNVVVWNRDWSDLLTHKPEFQLKAILGRNTSLFDVERFEEWGQENSITTHIEENAGQQSVFKFTDLLRKYF